MSVVEELFDARGRTVACVWAHGGNRLASTAAVLVLAAALVAVPAANATAGPINLTGVVTAKNDSLPGGATVVTFKKRTKKVGAFMIDTSGNCALDLCVQGGKGTLSVGKLKGKLKLVVDFKLHGFPPKRGNSGTGKLTDKHGKTESVRVNVGEFPTKIGSKFMMVVSS
jgi:hypothetical protein